MTDAPERIWATPFDPEVMEGGTYCDAAARPTAPNHDAWCYIRADLSSPLGAVAMRDAAIAEIDCGGCYGSCVDPANCRIEDVAAIRALPLPTHAALLAAALKLPEVAALVEAGKVLAAMADRYDPPDGDDDLECWSGLAVPRIKHIRNLRTALSALEAKP